MEKHRILIADDNEINRLLLSSMLEDNYELLQTENGVEALALIENYHGDVDLLLLDLIMPEKDGIEVLKEMNEQGWINDIPVIVISAETDLSIIRKSYKLGAEDYINRPFDPETVTRRIQKSILLHSERKNLIDAVTEEFAARERQNDMMISILSHVVEQRNGESGAHIIHVNMITELLLKALIARTDRYDIKEEDISAICSASSFHDIGKMAIPESILNKPGKLTDEEFEIMKTHSMLGYEMLCQVEAYQDEPLIQYSKNICRHHHERWNGRGYSDKLAGDEIPIEAQIVSIADVYDALTSERCYKKAFTHEKALQMIKNGECGIFNPILIACLDDISEVLRTGLTDDDTGLLNHDTEKLLSQQTLNKISVEKGADVSRNIRLLRSSERRRDTFRMVTDEAWFEYYAKPEMMRFNPPAMALLGLPKKVAAPFSNPAFLKKCGKLMEAVLHDEKIDDDNDMKDFDQTVLFADEKTYRLQGRIFFINDEEGRFKKYVSGAVGKISCLD